MLAGGEPPRELNPEGVETPAPEGEKPIEEMSREELVSILVRESITDDVSDDQIREGIRHLRDRHAADDKPADEPLKDAAGDDVPPPTEQEANKGKDDGVEDRTLPAAKPAPATDARPEDAKKKEADDKPAGNVTEAAKTPPDDKKGTTKANEKTK